MTTKSSTIDFQGLLAVLHAAENEPNLDMGAWECGTSHCMVGAFCHQNPTDDLYLDNNDIYLKDSYFSSPPMSISTRFGITTLEARWLFMHMHPFFTNTPSTWFPADESLKEQALGRLRKFIYYKLHKQEMIVESNERNRPITDLGRNISGRSSALLAAKA